MIKESSSEILHESTYRKKSIRKLYYDSGKLIEVKTINIADSFSILSNISNYIAAVDTIWYQSSKHGPIVDFQICKIPGEQNVLNQPYGTWSNNRFHIIFQLHISGEGLPEKMK